MRIMRITRKINVTFYPYNLDHLSSQGNDQTQVTTTCADTLISMVDEDYFLKELQRKTRLEKSLKKQKEYINSFTVHGLTRVLVGSKIESIIWLLILTSAITLSAFVIRQKVKKYLTFEVNSIVRQNVKNDYYFPSVVICEKTLLMNAYFAFCGVPILVSTPRNCSNVKPYTSETTLVEGVFWSNGIFNVTVCRSWDNQNCLNGKYFKSVNRHNNSCIEFNYDGTFSDIYRHVTITFDFHKPSFKSSETRIVLVASDPRIHEIDMTRLINIMPWQFYNIVLEKTFIKRLPAPYPSNCSEEKTYDIFPGKYARRQCVESYSYSNIYQKCGATFDYHQQYLNKQFLNKYNVKNKSSEDLRNCIARETIKKQKDYPTCNFPCNEMDLNSVTHTSDDSTLKPNKNRKNNTYRYKIELSHRVVDTYTIIEETPRYTWDQLLSEIGGFLGLVIGASIMSVFEILACIIIKLFSLGEGTRTLLKRGNQKK